MVKIRLVSTEENLFSYFESSGHAGMSENGKDIVCSAITILLKTAILTLLSAEEKSDSLKLKINTEDRGYLSAKVESFSEDDQDRLKYLLEFLILGLSSIKAEYSDYLDLKIESANN